MTVFQVIWTLVKIAIMAGFVLNLAAVLTWADRRQSSMIQDRIGPNRAVIRLFGREFRLAGLLHPLADGLKFFTKEDFIPPRADRLLYRIAPMLALGMVFTLVATIPFGDTICPREFRLLWPNVFVGPAVERWGTCSTDVARGTSPIELMIAPLGIGILFVFAMSGQGVIAAAFAGYSSDNKFSLMGALRAAAQMVSYEVTLGLSLVGAMMVYGSVRLDDMVRWQQDHAWGIVVQPLAFVLFFAAAVAENKRIPFDIPEAESELVSGYFTEYSGMKFGMFYFAEYAEVVTGSMLLVAIFLGGWTLPFFHRDGLTVQFGQWVVLRWLVPHVWMILLGVAAFFGKVLVVCMLQVFVRWSLPRLRYDQLMKLGWRILLPASFVNIGVTGILVLGLDAMGPAVERALAVAGDVSQAVVAAGIIYGTVRLVWGFRRPIRHHSLVLGSSAIRVAKHGRTERQAMQS
ncbi:MAG: complex I subunit 1 family protein [Polyangiaceae bacterium]|jgi:NADH-quinone oxidoreductase subunit H